MWKLAACEAKCECEEILETTGEPCRDIRKDLPGGKDRMSVNPQILQQWINIKMRHGKATSLIRGWKITVKKENLKFFQGCCIFFLFTKTGSTIWPQNL